MKKTRDNPGPLRREIFVLTPQEKTTVCVILLALLLGFATKRYRDSHPRSLPKPEIDVREQTPPQPTPRHARFQKSKPRN